MDFLPDLVRYFLFAQVGRLVGNNFVPMFVSEENRDAVFFTVTMDTDANFILWSGGLDGGAHCYFMEKGPFLGKGPDVEKFLKPLTRNMRFTDVLDGTVKDMTVRELKEILFETSISDIRRKYAKFLPPPTSPASSLFGSGHNDTSASVFFDPLTEVVPMVPVPERGSEREYLYQNPSEDLYSNTPHRELENLENESSPYASRPSENSPDNSHNSLQDTPYNTAYKESYSDTSYTMGQPILSEYFSDIQGTQKTRDYSEKISINNNNNEKDAVFSDFTHTAGFSFDKLDLEEQFEENRLSLQDFENQNSNPTNPTNKTEKPKAKILDMPSVVLQEDVVTSVFLNEDLNEDPSRRSPEDDNQDVQEPVAQERFSFSPETAPSVNNNNLPEAPYSQYAQYEYEYEHAKQDKNETFFHQDFPSFEPVVQVPATIIDDVSDLTTSETSQIAVSVSGEKGLGSGSGLDNNNMNNIENINEMNDGDDDVFPSSFVDDILPLPDKAPSLSGTPSPPRSRKTSVHDLDVSQFPGIFQTGLTPPSTPADVIDDVKK